MPAETTDVLPSADHLQAAYERTAKVRDSIGPNDLVAFNVDLAGAVTTTIGNLGRLRTLRSSLLPLPGFKAENLDLLEDLALAALQANSLYRVAATKPSELGPLVEEGTTLRDTFLTDAAPLVRRKLIDGQPVTEVTKGPAAYKVVAKDLIDLTNHFRANWSKIAGKTAIDEKEIERARVVAEQILAAVGARDSAPTAPADVADQRARAFTAFVRAYNAVRNGVQFLRYEQGDADTFAPSLYGGRNRGGKNDANAEAPATAPAAAAPAAAPPAATPAKGTGLPGEKPFT